MADERKFLRKCVGCGGYKPKSEFIKITADSKSGEIFINPLNNIYELKNKIIVLLHK